jgi:hypothetical protein
MIYNHKKSMMFIIVKACAIALAYDDKVTYVGKLWRKFLSKTKGMNLLLATSGFEKGKKKKKT